MGRLAQINLYRALTSVVTAIVLGLSLLLVSVHGVQAARPTGDTTPPTVRTVVPADNATGGAPTTNVEATFSEAMNASTITGSTFTLAKVGTTNPVAARITYDPATTKATLDPNADLDPGAKYTATVMGGKKGVKDLAGNWLRDNRTWSFTTAVPPPSADCPKGEFLAEYYNNMTLSGSPTLTRCEASINNTWGTGGPGSGVGTDNFSVRWNGMHSFEAGDYTFTATTDDGLRVWVDSELIIDQWKDQVATYNATHTMTAGDHQVKVEYYENLEGATAQLSWRPRTVALTFDDGPQQNSTPQILDTLRDYNVDATFFVMGQKANALPDLVRREYAEGHSVQNHSYTHRDLTSLSETEVQRELADTNAAIEAAGLPRPHRFRPPYGVTNATVERVGQSLGLTQTLADVSPEDWAGASASTICSTVVQGVKPGSVVVLHDASADDGVSVYNTNDALPCIINTLRQDGYRFVTM